MKVLLKYLGMAAVTVGMGVGGFAYAKNSYQEEATKATTKAKSLDEAIANGTIVREVSSTGLSGQINYMVKTTPLDKTIESVYKTFTAEEIKAAAFKASKRMESENISVPQNVFPTR